MRVTPEPLDVPFGLPSGSHQLWPGVPVRPRASSPTDQVTGGVPGACRHEMMANSQSPVKLLTGTGRERVPGSGMPVAVSGNANDADPATLTVSAADAPAVTEPPGAARVRAAVAPATVAPALTEPAGAAKVRPATCPATLIPVTTDPAGAAKVRPATAPATVAPALTDPAGAARARAETAPVTPVPQVS